MLLCKIFLFISIFHMVLTVMACCSVVAAVQQTGRPVLWVPAAVWVPQPSASSQLRHLWRARL